MMIINSEIPNPRGSFSLDLSLLIVHLLVACVIVIFFSLFLYKPLNKWLKKRSNYIKELKLKTETKQKETELLKINQEKEILKTKKKILIFESESEIKIDNLKKDIIIKAELSRKEIIKIAKIDADKLKELAEKEIKDLIIENTFLLSKKILEKEINKELHEKLIHDFIKEIDDQ